MLEVTESNSSRRREQLRDGLLQLDLDAFITHNSSNRQYLSGFTGSFGLVIIAANGSDLLLTDSRYIEQAQSQCPGLSIVEFKRDWSIIARQLRDLGVNRAGYESYHVAVQWLTEAQENITDVEWVGTQGIVEDLRIVKDQSEIAAIREAQEITEAVFAEILESVKPGIVERDLATEFMYLTRKHGAENLPFDPIIASGPRSALPHGRPTDKVIQAGEFVTFDIGAKIDGYRSDMTRTIVVGKADARQREVYELVLKAEEVGIAAMRSGQSGQEIDAMVRDVIDSSEYKEYAFRYGVGHGVGLDIHERPLFSAVCPDTLSPGMVITMEPGIYIPGWGGVRIEDMVVVTEGDPEVISTTTKKLLEV